MAFTVTATPGGASWSRGVDLEVRVYTNATESGGATSGGRNTAAGAAQGSLTPNFSSSAVVWAITSDTSNTWPAAAANNAYDTSASHNHTDGWESNAGHYTGTVTASSALTYGAGSTATSADHENWCAYEIPASGGTVTLDGSSPTSVTNDTGLTATTASFSPPVGSVLVAMVAAGGTGSGAGITCTISDTSGLGLVWTQRVTSSSSDNFQPTFIFTATVPAASPDKAMGNPPRPWPAPLTGKFGPMAPFTGTGVQIDAVQPVIVSLPCAQVNINAPAPTIPRYIAGLGGSGYNSYFVDQYGAPKLMLLEQAWMLPTNAGRWNSGNWQSDMDTYFATRASQGYTAWYGIAWNNTHLDAGALSGGRTWDGVYPLNVNGTPGAIATGSETITLNNSFWTRIDYMFASAKAQGITCFLNVSQSYDISSTTCIWKNATNTQGGAFGAALVARYPQSSYPNVFWFFGDDDDGPNDSFYQAILTGMQGAGDTRALISDEQFTNTNCHISFSAGSAFGGTFGVPNSTYNWVYSYDAPYFGVEDSYTEGGSFTHIPPVYGDGVYYGDSGSGTTADRAIRNFTWWALSSGARGIPSTSGPSDIGSGTVWQWQSGAVAALTSDPNGNGTWTTSVVGSITSYFTGLTDWNKLIPDTGNALITAGRGTRGTCDAAGGVFNFRNSNAYVCGSITPTGSLAVIYCKAAMSITIDQTKMQTGYTATWVDPVTLATTPTTTGTTYSSSGLGNNSAGDPDWVLVLQGPPTATVSLTTAQVTIAAPAPTLAVQLALTTAQVTVAAPAPVPGDSLSLAVAQETIAAPAPSPNVSLSLSVAQETINAPAPTISASSSLAVAQVTINAPAPAVATGVTVGLTTAAVTINALAPTLAASSSLSVAQVNINAPAPTIAAGVSASLPVAAVAISAPAPTLSTSSSLAVAQETVSAPSPAAALSLPLAVAQVSISAPPPSVAGAPPSLSLPRTDVAASALVPASAVQLGLAAAHEALAALAPTTGLQVGLSVAHVTESAHAFEIRSGNLPPLKQGAGGSVSAPRAGGNATRRGS